MDIFLRTHWRWFFALRRGLLRGRRADVQEVGKTQHLPEELKKFGLPIFERVATHLDEIARHLCRLMLARLVHERVRGKYPVANDRSEKEDGRDPSLSISLHTLFPACFPANASDEREFGPRLKLCAAIARLDAVKAQAIAVN